MKRSIVKSIVSIVAIVVVGFVTAATVRHFRAPGQLDVVTAQAMDMSAMRPPTGAAPVELTQVRSGSLADTVTYTGTIQAFNTQEISSRVPGAITALSVYPGDSVRAGQTVVRLDSAELSAKTAEAEANAKQADFTASESWATHHLHHQFALEQAGDISASAQQNVRDAEGAQDAAQADIAAEQADASSARANQDYWTAEIAREKKLLDAGAVSLSEYQSEQAQATAANSAVSAADAKIRTAQANAQAATARTAKAQKDLATALSGQRMAAADIELSRDQAMKDTAGAQSAHASVTEAAVVQGYTELHAPASGVVTERPVAPGSLVQPGTVILRIAEIDKVRVQANVAVADMQGIHIGSPVAITPQGLPVTAARVTAIFPSASDESRTAVVEAAVANPGSRLIPGGFVSMTITRDVHTASTIVPTPSIVTSGDGSFVWIVRREAATSTATVYECSKCHMRYSAADAKKNNYVDPMDGGKIVPVVDSSAPADGGTGPWIAHRVSVTPGASDGVSTEVSSPELLEGDRVVKRGMAGLAEGAQAVEAVWGADGAVAATAGAQAKGTRYKCDKCGMIYSEADAKKLNFRDPMDGGHLLPVVGN